MSRIEALKRVVTLGIFALTLVAVRGTAWTDLGDQVLGPDTVSWEIMPGL
jgi:hypothetical protein